MREAGILAFDNSKYVYMNPQYFSRGTAPMNTCFTRVYTNFYREAYEKYGDVRRHKLLAYGFRLVPYISHHHNVLCKNPQEPCLDKLIPYQMQEIYDILRYNSHTGRRLIDDLLNIKINDQYMMTVYSSTVEAPAKKLFVNPRLLYAGGHPDEMRSEYDYMILKHHPEEGQALLSTQVYHT